MMCERALCRETQGSVLADKQSVQNRSPTRTRELMQFRLFVLYTAWTIDRYKDYRKVRHDIAAVKVLMPTGAARTSCSARSRCTARSACRTSCPSGACGWLAPVMALVDGPTEVHKVTVARQVLKRLQAVRRPVAHRAPAEEDRRGAARSSPSTSTTRWPTRECHGEDGPVRVVRRHRHRVHHGRAERRARRPAAAWFRRDHDLNWVRPGVVGALAAAGHRVIALDARGHGASDKPHDPAAYMGDAMPRDAQGLLDHLGVEQVDVVGYSMGSVVASRLVPIEPRTRRLVLGGVGGGLVTGQLPSADIADALLTDDPTTITSSRGQALRAFAESTGADLHALWAIQKARVVRDGTPLGDIHVPTLVLVGRDDRLVGPPEPLAAAIEGREAEDRRRKPPHGRRRSGIPQGDRRVPRITIAG